MHPADKRGYEPRRGKIVLTMSEFQEPVADLRNTYYLMRHGISVPNKEGIIISTIENGARPEHGLVAPDGYEQAEQSALASGLGEDTLIVASPFSRTIQTAEVLQRVAGAGEIEVDKRLRERHFGRLELESADNYGTVWERDARSATHTSWGVESLCSVAQREFKLLASLEETHIGRVIVLVGHADPLNILRAGFARKSLRTHRKAFSIANAEILPLKPAS